MHYRSESEGVPRVNVSISYTEQDWYTTLTRKVTPIIQLKERALVVAEMSMLWALQNPKGFPVYGYKGNGDDGEEETNVDPAPTREEPIILSSEESAGLYQDLVQHSTHAGPQRGATREPAVEAVDTPVVDLQAGAAEQVETRKKKKEDKTEGKKAEEPVAETPLVENVVAGTVRDEVHAEGVETEYESSEATLQGTVYTKRMRGSRGSGASGSQQAPEFHRVQGGSWGTHNPTYDDLLLAPHWTLTQDSRMVNLPNCRKFYSLSLPLDERLFQKNCHRMDLLDDHIHVGAMGEDTMEFEAAKREFAAEREAFNAEKKGLLWRVADGEEKLVKEKQFNADRQKEWETAYERTNRELKAARDEIVRLKGEKTKQSNEHERAIAVYQKRETEYEHQVANLEMVVAEKTAESKVSEILVEEISADCKWLLARGVPLIADRIVKSDELAKYMFELGKAAFDSGHKEGYGKGRAVATANEKVDHFELYKVDCSAHYASKGQEYEFLKFAIVRAVENLSRKGAAVETLKKALGDQDMELKFDHVEFRLVCHGSIRLVIIRQFRARCYVCEQFTFLILWLMIHYHNF
ncbi:hypothetical protein HanRHA438_Chr03g0116731 [Helianthus annuus]|uniref:Uncharacterized protein n=1 Tax=Helianthus annuus TaxID=4232 RepID=A0A9K3JED0_HELAN|nr:hypothetical protein HanXRQr2_Chr03g0106031 [Helianthus annuus]KAJ0592721.1 hypothetical protein HanHA300_Chr03g0088441 [Helianthus annuus]KAJ0600363.1 hypothetical protein HanIR_Chr03g0115751 [Helianthus annuus]KAJ0607720.1 hypothetical protein HanHA89_Chr03g0100031 [Helianthus annuus]KAJ0767785.1 hypothetical protein HanLR1_Chr03g0093411 [Helianthus annuus]